MNESVSQVPAYGDDRAVVQSWRVPHSFGGSRADVYLAEKIGRISREKCRLLIARGDFRRQDLPIKPATRLGGGDEVSFWRIPPDAKPEQNWEVNVWRSLQTSWSSTNRHTSPFTPPLCTTTER